MTNNRSTINQEYHVASFVAQCMPQFKDKISEMINQLDGLEVHAIDPQGKIIFTCEAESQKAISRATEEIQHYPEILSLSPVYHQFLDAEQLAQEG